MGTPYKPFTSMLRLIVALNGVAALLLTAFSLGILGADVDAPDLSEPLEWFLGGLASGGLALLLIFLTQLWREHRARQSRPLGGHLGLILAVLAFAGAMAGFCMGCWVASSYDTSDSGQASASQARYAGKPLLPHPAPKIVFYR